MSRPIVKGLTTRPVGVRIPAPTVALLDQLAAARGVHRSEMVRLAVAELLDREALSA